MHPLFSIHFSSLNAASVLLLMQKGLIIPMKRFAGSLRGLRNCKITKQLINVACNGEMCVFVCLIYLGEQALRLALEPVVRIMFRNGIA